MHVIYVDFARTRHTTTLPTHKKHDDDFAAQSLNLCPAVKTHLATRLSHAQSISRPYSTKSLSPLHHHDHARVDLEIGKEDGETAARGQAITHQPAPTPPLSSSLLSLDFQPCSFIMCTAYNSIARSPHNHHRETSMSASLGLHAARRLALGGATRYVIKARGGRGESSWPVCIGV